MPLYRMSGNRNLASTHHIKRTPDTKVVSAQNIGGRAAAYLVATHACINVEVFIEDVINQEGALIVVAHAVAGDMFADAVRADRRMAVVIDATAERGVKAGVLVEIIVRAGLEFDTRPFRLQNTIRWRSEVAPLIRTDSPLR